MSPIAFKKHFADALFVLIGLSFFFLSSCNQQPFPQGGNQDGLRDVPYIKTYNFNLLTGSGPIVATNPDGSLKIISSADLLTLLASAQDEQLLGRGVVSGTALYNGQPVSDVALKVTDAAGTVLAIRMEGRIVGSDLVLPDGTLCPSDASRADDICIKGSLYYNSPGGVPDFSNNRGTSDAGSFTIFNLPPGEVYLWTARGARGNGRITVYADTVSIGKMQVLPIPVASVGVLGTVVEADNETTAVSDAQVSVVGLEEPVTAMTGGTGIYSVPRLQSNGSYLLKVTKSGYTPTYNILGTPLSAVTLPSFEITATDRIFRSNYVASLLQSGKPLNSSLGMLAGRITAPDSTPQSCAQITVTDSNGNDLTNPSFGSAVVVYLDPGSAVGCDASVGPDRTGSDGRYFIYNLPPGQVYLSYTAKVQPSNSGTDPVVLYGDAIVRVFDGSVFIRDLKNEGNGKTLALSGKVTEEDGSTPVPGGAQVQVVGVPAMTYTAGGVSVALPVSSDAITGDYEIPANDATDSVLPLASGGGYVLNVSAAGHIDSYQAIQMGATNIKQNLISISSLSSPSSNHGHLLGTAIDTVTGKGAEDLTVIATDTAGNVLGSAKTLGQGEFTIENLPSGLVNLQIDSQDDTGNGQAWVYSNGVNIVTFLVTQALSRTVQYPTTTHDIDQSLVSGMSLSVIGKSQQTASGGGPLDLESNGRFRIIATKSGYHDSYNDHVKTYLFDRSDGNVFNDLFVASRTLTSQVLGTKPDPAFGIVGGTVVGNDFVPAVCTGCVVTTPGKSALGFFNGDTIFDLAILDLGDSTVKVLFGDGTGNFSVDASYTVGTAPSDVVSADFNGDGNPDLAVADSMDNTLSIFLGNRDGKYSRLVTDVGGVSTPYFLVDKDGLPADSCGDALDPLVTPCSPTSTATILNTPIALAIGDFNEDGFPDLAAISQGTKAANILLGTGSGAFYLLRDNNQSPLPPVSVGDQPVAMAAVDVDLDGHIDLVVADDKESGASDGTVRILRGTGDGSFSLLSNDSGGSPATVVFPVGPFPSSVTSGDFNGDGRPDLAVISTDGTLRMIMGTTNSQEILQPLQDADQKPICPILGASPCKVGNVPSAMTTGEFNGDARTDLAIVNSGNNTLTLLLGNGDGTFTPMPSSSLSGTVGSTPSLLIGDLNRDGLFDLVVTGGTVSPLLGEEKPLSGISVQATDMNGVSQGNGNVFYFNDTGTGVDYGLTATSGSGRFIILHVAPGLTQVRASTGGAGNRITTVYPDGYTHVSLKVVNIQPFTISVSGYVLDPVGPPPQGVGVGNVHVHLLGTTCEANSDSGSNLNNLGIYNFSGIFANSEFIAEMLFTPPPNLPPPPSGC